MFLQVPGAAQQTARHRPARDSSNQPPAVSLLGPKVPAPPTAALTYQPGCCPLMAPPMPKGVFPTWHCHGGGGAPSTQAEPLGPRSAGVLGTGAPGEVGSPRGIYCFVEKQSGPHKGDRCATSKEA